MKDTDIVWRLAALASLPYQERYVINGSKDKYAVDTELIEDVDSIQYILELQEGRSSLTDDQMTALGKLFDLIERKSGEALARHSREDAADLIRGSNVWRELREKSAAALKTFGVSIEDMTAEDVAQLAE